MWRSSKKLIISCIEFIIRCGRPNLDADDWDIPDMPEFEFEDVPVYFQPQTFASPIVQVRPNDFQHRPDAPGARRRSPPEILCKVRQALEEMSEPTKSPLLEQNRGDLRSFESSIKLTTTSLDESQ